MTVPQICELPVADIAAKDSVLFLWATFPNLPEAFEVIQAWGFTYKTVAFVWVKQNKKAPSWFWGLGFWTRSNAEICLLATKGKPKRQSARIHQIIDSPIEGHSKKPDEARTRIIELMGDLPRIELFARQETAGWDVWGNEVKHSIVLQHKGAMPMNIPQHIHRQNHAAIKPYKAARHTRILELLTECGDMTAQEIATKLYQRGFVLSDDRNYAAPRLTELYKAGKVQPAGKTTCAKTGRTVTVWTADMRKEEPID